MRETFQEYSARMRSLVGSDDPVGILTVTPATLGRLLAGRTVDELQRRPAADRWSAAQILSHLADAEIVLAYRMRRILASPGCAIDAYEQDAWVSAQHADTSDALESLALFTAVRTANLRLFARLGEEERQRAGLHRERGQETIAHVVTLYAGHDRNHLAQIERLLGSGRR